MENLGQTGHRRLTGGVFERLAHGHHVRAIRPVSLKPAPLAITAPAEAKLDHVVGIVVTDDQGLDVAQQNDAVVPVQAVGFFRDRLAVHDVGFSLLFDFGQHKARGRGCSDGVGEPACRKWRG